MLIRVEFLAVRKEPVGKADRVQLAVTSVDELMVLADTLESSEAVVNWNLMDITPSDFGWKFSNWTAKHKKYKSSVMFALKEPELEILT